MIPKNVLQYNRQRRAIRARMARDAKAYAASSTKLVAALDKLSQENLRAFLKKNPDVLFDIGGGVAAKVGARAKAVASSTLKELGREFKKEWTGAKTKGAKKAGTWKTEVEKRGLEYLKRLLAL